MLNFLTIAAQSGRWESVARARFVENSWRAFCRNDIADSPSLRICRRLRCGTPVVLFGRRMSLMITLSAGRHRVCSGIGLVTYCAPRLDEMDARAGPVRVRSRPAQPPFLLKSSGKSFWGTAPPAVLCCNYLAISMIPLAPNRARASSEAAFVQLRWPRSAACTTRWTPASSPSQPAFCQTSGVRKGLPHRGGASLMAWIFISAVAYSAG